jgi:hypothetical protein
MCNHVYVYVHVCVHKGTRGIKHECVHVFHMCVVNVYIFFESVLCVFDHLGTG